MVWQDFVQSAEELLERDNLRNAESFVARQDAILKSEEPDDLWSRGALYGAAQILLYIAEKKD